MTSTGTAVRPRWEQLPAQLRNGLAARLGDIERAQMQTGGFTPRLADRLRLTGRDRVFVKGIPADHSLAGRYRDEVRVVRALPAAVPAPRLRWDEVIGVWVVLAFDDAGGNHADLAPGSADLAPVVETVAGLVHGWRELAAAP